MLLSGVITGVVMFTELKFCLENYRKVEFILRQNDIKRCTTVFRILEKDDAYDLTVDSMDNEVGLIISNSHLVCLCPVGWDCRL